MEQRIETIMKKHFGRGIDQCTNEEIFQGLLLMTKEELEGRPAIEGKKKVYYISAEFLIGKLLSNNLINLGLYEDVKEALKKHGKELSEIEECELEPSLGNGGLGRLAACFLDSIASLELPGDGVGLNYHFGLFEQRFENYKQKEVKNFWLSENNWLELRDVSFDVPFRFFTAHSKMYDIDIPGYDVKGTNRLHLFDLDTVDDNLVGNDDINFDKYDVAKNLTLFLYPDDSDRQGQLLRVYQQYFMVSNGAQLILKECKEKGYDLHKLADHVAIQINDTHPSMVIPELIRLLQIEGFTMDEAIEVVTAACAYTNHTILVEALEKWPVDYLEEVVPHLLPIIRELDNRLRKKYDDKSVYIIDDGNRVHMAH
ncbi:MAG: glycogen/starch/alpha-glucan phosphorylase, partial [Lachnospiraceae bacterium]|nr:glycogen/starch/alpha-glucan phosphorylase [Lachnospiraceae bacterium]